jgi:hypothetical protein
MAGKGKEGDSSTADNDTQPVRLFLNTQYYSTTTTTAPYYIQSTRTKRGEKKEKVQGENAGDRLLPLRA